MDLCRARGRQHRYKRPVVSLLNRPRISRWSDPLRRTRRAGRFTPRREIAVANRSNCEKALITPAKYGARTYHVRAKMPTRFCNMQNLRRPDKKVIISAVFLHGLIVRTQMTRKRTRSLAKRRRFPCAIDYYELIEFICITWIIIKEFLL